MKSVKVLIPQQEIENRVKELAREIASQVEGELLVIALLKGAFVFTADLVRHLSLPLQVDFIRAKSYRGTERGELSVVAGPELPVEGKTVLLVDDIFDSGKTLETVAEKLKEMGASKVLTCVLLEKELGRDTDFRPDFVGFKVPDYFVVGYGLDLNETYRQLPYIATVEGEEDGQI